jgi:hypothetical protein
MVVHDGVVLKSGTKEPQRIGGGLDEHTNLIGDVRLRMGVGQYRQCGVVQGVVSGSAGWCKGW